MSNSNKGRRFKPKFRYDCVKMVLEDGLSNAEVAQKKGIGKSTLSKWVSDFKKSGNKIEMNDDKAEPPIDTFTMPKHSDLATIQELRGKLKKAMQENEILKKTISILSADSG